MEQEYGKLFPIFPQDAIVRKKAHQNICITSTWHYVESGEYYTALPNLVPAISKTACPILGICGRHDPSPDRPELLSAMANFEEIWIAGARRFTMMEAGERV